MTTTATDTRLATGKQLWRLNQAGRLALVDPGPPLTLEGVYEAVKESISQTGSEQKDDD